MTRRKPTCVSLFAGCGGSSLGYERAGFRVVGACEWDGHSAESYRRNHPRTLMVERDVREVSGDELLGGAASIDLLDGSPPCQGFSTSGNRRLDDERNTLWAPWRRLARELEPRAIVFENVTGILQRRMRPVFDALWAALESDGWKLSAGILDANWYGLPQRRQRVFVIGTRDREPGLPEPGEPGGALGEILEVMTIEETRGKALNESTRLGMNVIRRRTNQRTWLHAEQAHWEKPCPTVTTFTGNNWYSPAVHPDGDCTLSLDAGRVVMGFPRDYDLSGGWQEQWRQLGEAVCPAVAEAVGRHVLGVLRA